jgi:hypothetical protein
MRRPFLLLFAITSVACSDQSVTTNNSPPEAVILEPAPDWMAETGETATFRGAVQDVATSGEDLSVTWSSSLDGTLFSGFADSDGTTVHATADLGVGEHTITLRVVDGAGATGTDAIGITVLDPVVPNTNPTCEITDPADDDRFVEGDGVVLEGTASDGESDLTDLTATWASSEDGELGVTNPSSSGRVALPVSDLSVGTHVVTLDVADPDGGNCSEFIVVHVDSGNQRPSVGAPTLTPDPLLTTTSASCTAPAASDPDGDTVTVAWRWLVDGSDVAETGTSLDASLFVKGETVSCEVTPSDAGGDGPSANATLTVADTPPTAPTAAITPLLPVEDTDGLQCLVDVAATDIDGDALTYAVTWTLDGSPWTGATTMTLWSGDTVAVGDASAGLWECTLTPVADAVWGPAATASVTVVLANQRPSITAPVMLPNPLLTTTGASCVAPPATDPENDPITLVWGWTVEGTAAGGALDNLPATEFIKGQSVECTVTPSDAGGPGTPGIATLVVADTPPTAPGIAIFPPNPIAGQQLDCLVDTPAVDDDGELVTYAATWTFNSAAFPSTSTTVFPDDTIAASTVGTWACTVTPTADGVAGPTASTQVTVAAALPPGKLVFLTSVTTNGNMGGTSGADGFCQNLASAAGLPGTFLAWLSGSSYGSSPASRFTQSNSNPYVRLDGAVVANDWSDLTDGSIQNTITVDEYGNPQSWFAYSFTQVDGSNGLFGSSGSNCYGVNCHCDNWTTNNTGSGSAVADTSRTDDDWTDYSFGNFCGQSFRLMCFQQ